MNWGEKPSGDEPTTDEIMAWAVAIGLWSGLVWAVTWAVGLWR